MKLKIFTEGGQNIGYGHISRCSSLYDEVVNRGLNAEIIINGKFDGIELLKDKNIVYENWLSEDYMINHVTNDDLVIVDSYLADLDLCKSISKETNKVLFIDDNGRIDHPKGIIVNPSLSIDSIDYSKKIKNRVIYGRDYIILREPFKNIERTNFNNSVEKVLITLGGTDILGLIPVIIENIIKENSDLEFYIVLGTDDFEKYIDKYLSIKNIKMYKNLSALEMKDLMLSVDMAITGAGQTIYELMATKTPFIAIQIIDNQKNNVNSIKKYFSHEFIIEDCQVDFSLTFMDKFEKMLELNNRKKIIKIMEDINLGYGAKNIISELVDSIFSLRKAEERDIKDVFDLSNMDYVREYSINKGKILWENHKTWFEKAITDNNISFYIITDYDQSFLGQIRYQIENDFSTVSISLLDLVRGKGLSKKILDMSIHKFFTENINIDTIYAFVLKDNEKSMKLFKGLNFKFIKSEDKMLKLKLKRGDYYEDR